MEQGSFPPFANLNGCATKFIKKTVQKKEPDLIPRYTRAEMGRVWSDENRFQKWLAVELAAAETLAEAGIVPREAAVKLRERGRVNVERINELEAKVRHDVIAFTIAVQESVGDAEA